MTFNLTQLLTEVDTLPPSKRNGKLVAAALTHFRGDHQGLRRELDASFADLGIVPRDYALLLHATGSISWALDVLKTTAPSSVVITTAVDILGKAWRKDPSALKDIFGGDDFGVLINLIDKSLPRYATIRLFRSFGTVPIASHAHHHLVDVILIAMFPFLSANSPTPLKRYARSAVVVLFQAASPAVLMAIIERCGTWLHEGTWSHLAERRPEIVADVLICQVDSSHPKYNMSLEIVQRKEWNQSTLTVLIRRQKNNGAFFKRFLDLYISRVVREKITEDILGASRATRAAVLIPFISFVLRKRTDPKDVFQVALLFCKTLTKLVDSDLCELWTWESASPLLEVARQEFEKSPDQWELKSVTATLERTDEPTATGLLLSIFNKQAYPKDTFTSPPEALIHHLRRLPLPARLPFLNLFYISKTSESLLETPTNPAHFPSYSPYLLSLLYPAHGRHLLKIGLKSREEHFINSSSGWYIGNKLRGLLDPNSAPTFLSAIWAGAERSPFGARAAELGQADEECTRDVAEYKKQASRSRDDRYGLTTKALSLALLTRSPALFVDTLSWAAKRFAKDPDTGPLLLSWLDGSNDYIINFLSGPVGLYACHRTRGTLTKDMLQLWCLKTDEIFDSLMHLLHIWAHEPSYISSLNGKYNSVGSVLFKIVEGRIGTQQLSYDFYYFYSIQRYSSSTCQSSFPDSHE